LLISKSEKDSSCSWMEEGERPNSLGVGLKKWT